MWYGALGVQNIAEGLVGAGPSQGAKFSDLVSLEVDGKDVPLSADLEGMVVLNIPTYSGGMNLWGPGAAPEFDVPSFCDGRLEVCGVRGSGHIAKVGVGMESAVRVAQGSSVTIRFVPGPPLPGKIDGEPWLQQHPCTFQISHKGRASVLARSKSAGARSMPETGNNSFFSGWLTKQGDVVKSWKLRFCTVCDGTFAYFESRQDPVPKGEIDLTSSQVSVRSSHRFEINNGNGRTYVVDCKDTQEGALLCLSHFCSVSPTFACQRARSLTFHDSQIRARGSMRACVRAQRRPKLSPLFAPPNFSMFPAK
jgi:Diacylglycerol kinase accessory domain/PH domain